MTEQLEMLTLLLKQVPTYGYGNVMELYDVYIKARPLILGVVAKENNKSMQYGMGISSVEIDTLISGARRAKTKKEQQSFFNAASAQLAEDIRTAIRLIKQNQ